MSAPDRGRARPTGLGQPSRGATRRISVSPKLSIARAALPIFSPSCGRTRTMTGGRAAVTLPCPPRSPLPANSSKSLRLAEILIDAGEADIGDAVERLAGPPSPSRRSASTAISLSPCVSSWRWIPETSRSIRSGVDRALAAGDRDRAVELVAIERLAPVLALDHGQLAQLDALERGEARARNPRTAAAGGSRRRPRSDGCPSPGCLHVRRRGSATISPPSFL